MLLFVAVNLRRQRLKRTLRLVQVEREPGRFPLQHLKPPGHGAAQVRDHFDAQLFVPAGFGSLALERIRLAADLFQNVEHARQILTGAFEPGLGQPLARFILADSRGFLDHRAAVGRFVRKNLADAALLDDGVALRAEAGAAEQILNIAQPRVVAVDLVFALAGTVETPRDGDVFDFSDAVAVAV